MYKLEGFKSIGIADVEECEISMLSFHKRNCQSDNIAFDVPQGPIDSFHSSTGSGLKAPINSFF